MWRHVGALGVVVRVCVWVLCWDGPMAKGTPVRRGGVRVKGVGWEEGGGLL